MISRGEERRLYDAAVGIARITHDYEPTGGMTVDAVLAWAEQFPDDLRVDVVGELANILTETYVSRATLTNLLKRLLDRQLFKDQVPARALEDIQFLDLQGAGSSQRDMLDALDEVLDQRGLTRRVDRDAAGTYVYLDDCIHTGNRIRYDLTSADGGSTPAWIDKDAPDGCRLVICVLALHQRGWNDYARGYVARAAARKNVDLLGVRVHRQLTNDEHFHPVAVADPPDAVTHYVDWLDERRSKRNLSHRGYLRRRRSEGLCSSPQGRDVLERALLARGAELRSWEKKAEMRPLGFDKLDTLGFGSAFISYRNIPNTAPLALWYGPGSLFPRA